MVQNFPILPQRKATDAQRFEIGTLAVYPDVLVRGGCQLVARGRGRRGHSERQARARARFWSGDVPESKGWQSTPWMRGVVGRHSEFDM